mmetsp:Transcript_14232/g.41502  ORF Transcript_14232/g.41502 Transcript_14232/m.41502 type:complete len:299 (+) Transcript_14232:376-1272(+)
MDPAARACQGGVAGDVGHVPRIRRRDVGAAVRRGDVWRVVPAACGRRRRLRLAGNVDGGWARDPTPRDSHTAVQPRLLGKDSCNKGTAGRHSVGAHDGVTRGVGNRHLQLFVPLLGLRRDELAADILLQSVASGAAQPGHDEDAPVCDHVCHVKRRWMGGRLVHPSAQDVGRERPQARQHARLHWCRVLPHADAGGGRRAAGHRCHDAVARGARIQPRRLLRQPHGHRAKVRRRRHGHLEHGRYSVWRDRRSGHGCDPRLGWRRGGDWRLVRRACRGCGAAAVRDGRVQRLCTGRAAV